MHSTFGVRRFAVACAIIVAGSLVVAPSLVSAQSGFELTPFLGAFIPLSNVMDQNDAEVKHQPNLAGGLRATLGGAGRMRFEGVLAYAAGAVK